MVALNAQSVAWNESAGLDPICCWNFCPGVNHPMDNLSEKRSTRKDAMRQRSAAATNHEAARVSTGARKEVAA